ncbi:MAG TPA: hypothetical protein VHI72_09415 [Hyphomicrobiaceae bacterium]|jgi:hypothetical protein|nr:hypothetical protein [Hyphomicrobiaceae bacterium]
MTIAPEVIATVTAAAVFAAVLCMSHCLIARRERKAEHAKREAHLRNTGA